MPSCSPPLQLISASLVTELSNHCATPVEGRVIIKNGLITMRYGTFWFDSKDSGKGFILPKQIHVDRIW